MGLLGLVAGCASYQPTQAEREAEAFVAQHDRAVAEAETCLREARAAFQRTPAGRRLKAIIISAEVRDPQLIEKMAIDRSAIRQEKQDLLDSRANYAPCNEAGLRAFTALHPAYGSLYAELLVDNDELLVQVLKDEITIGDLNRAYNRRDVADAKKWNALWGELRRDYNAAHNAELERREAAARQRELETISREIQVLGLQVRSLE